MRVGSSEGKRPSAASLACLRCGQRWLRSCSTTCLATPRYLACLAFLVVSVAHRVDAQSIALDLSVWVPTRAGGARAAVEALGDTRRHRAEPRRYPPRVHFHRRPTTHVDSACISGTPSIALSVVDADDLGAQCHRIFPCLRTRTRRWSAKRSCCSWRRCTRVCQPSASSACRSRSTCCKSLTSGRQVLSRHRLREPCPVLA